MSRLKLNDATNEDVSTNSSFEEAFADLSIAIVENDESVAGLEALEDLSDDLEQSTGRLAQYHELCNDSLESSTGGLSPDAAKALDIAINSIASDIGVDAYGSAAMESFESPATRADATEDVMVAVEGTMAKIAQGARNIAAKIWRVIKTTIAKLMTNTGRLRAAISTAVSKLGEIKPGKDGKFTYDKPEWYKRNAKLLSRLYNKGADTIPDTLALFSKGVDVIDALAQDSFPDSDDRMGKESSHALGMAMTSFQGGKKYYLCAGVNLTLKAEKKSLVFKKETRAADTTTKKEIDIAGLKATITQALNAASAVEKAKGLTDKVNRISKNVDKHLLESAADSTDGKFNDKKLKYIRAEAGLISKIVSFSSITLMTIMFKGSWDAVKLVKAVAKSGDKADKYEQSIGSGATKDNQSFDDYWDSLDV